MIARCQLCGQKQEVFGAHRCHRCNHPMTMIDTGLRLCCNDCAQPLLADHVCQFIDIQPPIYMAPGGFDEPPQAN